MSDPRFRPLAEIASPSDLRAAAAALAVRAEDHQALAYGPATQTDEERAGRLARAAAYRRIAEWLEHQARACPA